MKHYKLPQPNSNKNTDKVIDLLIKYPQEIEKIDLKSSNPYLGWKKFEAKFKSGAFEINPELKDYSADDLWHALRLKRNFSSQNTPILVNNYSDTYFRWRKTSYIERIIRDFDMKTGGVMAGSRKSDREDKQFFIRQNLIEEAIASSQLEGAAVTRPVAKEIINQNRKPISKHEKMIFNNYKTILKIENETKDYPLSKDVLLDLHKLLTKETLDDPQQSGRWRKNSDEIVIQSEIHNEPAILYVPPDEKRLEDELDKFIEYANYDDPDNFTHPLIKAIILHFWFAYLHPFCDGNGRLARAIFFWYLLKHEYFLISYLPISKLIKDSSAKYRDAYLFSEQYQNDLGYFIDYNLKKIDLAIEEFENYIEKIKQKRQQISDFFPEMNLNMRQKQLIRHFLNKSHQPITAKNHSVFHQITWMTAKKDLTRLEEQGLLFKKKVSKEVFYHPTKKLLNLQKKYHI